MSFALWSRVNSLRKAIEKKKRKGKEKRHKSIQEKEENKRYEQPRSMRNGINMVTNQPGLGCTQAADKGPKMLGFLSMTTPPFQLSIMKRQRTSQLDSVY
jgi:hypothetical protein